MEYNDQTVELVNTNYFSFNVPYFALTILEAHSYKPLVLTRKNAFCNPAFFVQIILLKANFDIRRWGTLKEEIAAMSPDQIVDNILVPYSQRLELIRSRNHKLSLIRIWYKMPAGK